jgi:deoxyribonuclease-2
MGCCYSSCHSRSLGHFHGDKKHFALKLPHGEDYLEYDEKSDSLVLRKNINEFTQKLYTGSSWTHWIVYNDDPPVISHTKRGHSKGILAWNESRISWLCHSVPCFPKSFTGHTISPIEPKELIYGQSFQYIEIPFSQDSITKIIHQLYWMEVNMYNVQGYMLKPFRVVNEKNEISEIQLTPRITHIAKSPRHEIDIYSDYLTHHYTCSWYVESWIRSHAFEPCSTVTDIRALLFCDETTNEKREYSEKQDHSKWAVSFEHDMYWIGDLNRMTSQKKRGGGGFVCFDAGLKRALSKLIVIQPVV